MKKRSLLVVNMLAFGAAAWGINTLVAGGSGLEQSDLKLLQEGDIVFQHTGGEQGRAVQLATGSPWTHVGILFKRDGQWTVYEAVGPVQSTPLDEWTTHGEAGHWTVKRLVDADQVLDAEGLARLRKAGARYNGLPYDLQFRWSEERIYCSELVWKMYKNGLGVELCAPKPMRENNLGSETVQRVMNARYGAAPPLDELMIAPGALFDCPHLKTVLER
ncbi:MAG TPA: YiiX family permuted papain-like enzyme [Flavobacteriales bacterium]|nr:YiiX family permuted papain-like enzyme [Flavobacteriales bacterium]